MGPDLLLTCRVTEPILSYSPKEPNISHSPKKAKLVSLTNKTKPVPLTNGAKLAINLQGNRASLLRDSDCQGGGGKLEHTMWVVAALDGDAGGAQLGADGGPACRTHT